MTPPLPGAVPTPPPLPGAVPIPPPRPASAQDGPRPTPQRRLWARGRARLEAAPHRSTPGGMRRSYEALAYRPLERLLARALASAGLDRRGRRNALDIRLERLELRLRELPARFDGYRILHLTDPHLDIDPDLPSAIGRAVAGLEVDLCVLTGDYRAANDGAYAHIAPMLATVLAGVSAGDGVWATLGNHDSHRMVAPFESHGIGVLVNETVRLRRGAHILSVTGLDDVNHYYTPQADLALTAAGPFGPRHVGLALVHSAEMAAEAAMRGYALYLCGHSHGGQICLPGGRPVLTNMTRNRRYAAGLWRHQRMVGYTSRGAGVSGVIARFHSRGEVTLFTLRRGG